METTKLIKWSNQALNYWVGTGESEGSNLSSTIWHLCWNGVMSPHNHGTQTPTLSKNFYQIQDLSLHLRDSTYMLNSDYIMENRDYQRRIFATFWKLRSDEQLLGVQKNVFTRKSDYWSRKNTKCSRLIVTVFMHKIIQYNYAISCIFAFSIRSPVSVNTDILLWWCHVVKRL